ncbi:MAG: RNA polymerase sigma factor [Clostridia bacterium]|nr:RNA polymerase sigma factor [Clostridia bacterium]
MTDEKIVALYWARSEDAIKETDKAYGTYCHYIAYNILREKEDANETVNDTYLKAWQSMPPQKPNPLKAFLGRITRQLSINRLEKKTAQKRGGEFALSLEELQNAVPDGSPDLADQVALADALTRFLHALPIIQRRVFIRRYWYLESIGEIADAFSMSESKVKSTLMRCRQKLKQHLIKEGFGR